MKNLSLSIRFGFIMLSLSFMSHAQSLINFNFGTPASLPAGASCSSSTSCTIAGATYFNVDNFIIPAGVTVKVTGNTPLIVYANSVTIAGTIDASGGTAGTSGGPSSAGGGTGGNGFCGYSASGSPGQSGYGTVSTGGGAGLGNVDCTGGPGGGGNAGSGGGGGGGRYGTGGSKGGDGGNGGSSASGLPGGPGGLGLLGTMPSNPGGNGSGYNDGGSGAGGAGGTAQYWVVQQGNGGTGGSGGDDEPDVSTRLTGGGGGGGSSHGGGGGGGGGIIKFVANSIMTISGSVTANGGAGNGAVIGGCGYGGSGGGGGAGGTVFLASQTLITSGSQIQAKGGNGGDGYYGGGGGGGGAGRIIVYNYGGVPPAGTFNPSIGYLGSYSATIFAKILVPDVVAKAGQSFDVIVNTSNLSPADNIRSYQFSLDYDQTKIEYSDKSLTETIAAGGSVDVNSTLPGHLVVTYTIPIALRGEGSIIRLNFNALVAGTSPLTLSGFQYNDGAIANITSGTATIKENVPPTASVTYSDGDALVKPGNVLTITATFSEPMADNPVPQIILSGANILAAVNMIKVSTTVYRYVHTVADGNGSVNVSLATGTDIAENLVVSTPTSGGSFTIDNIAPTAGITYSDADGIVKPGDVLKITFTFSEPIPDSPVPQISLSGATTLVKTNLLKITTTSYSYSYTVEDLNGAVNVSAATGTDAAGNVITPTPVSGGTFTIDNSAPSATITYSDTDGNVRVGDLLTITATFSEQMADVMVPRILLTGANTIDATDMTKVSATEYTYNHTVGAGNGTVNVALSTGTDIAGNPVQTIPLSGGSFNIIALKYGDADDNGNIEVIDGSLVLQYSQGLDPLQSVDPRPWEEWRLMTCDVDNVAGIMAFDASLILQKNAGTLITFPVEGSGMTVPEADVNVSVEDGYIVFRSSGSLYGLDLSVDQNRDLLGTPQVLNSSMLSATNISSAGYAVGLASATAQTPGEAFMKIPFTSAQYVSITFDLIINTLIRQVSVGIVTGMDERSGTDVLIYPNPAHNTLFVKGLFQNYDVSILDLSGKVVLDETATGNKIDISNLSNGIYTIIFSDKNGRITRRFIKQ